MLQTHLEVIQNIYCFKTSLRQQAIDAFIISYGNSKKFIEKYDESLLNLNDVDYEIKKYIFTTKSQYFISKENIEVIIKNLYQLLVEKILSKLVDEDVLELCWDSNIEDFIWRKKRKIINARK